MDIPLPQGTSGLAALTCPSENGLAFNYQLLTKINPISVQVGTFTYGGSWPMSASAVPALSPTGNLVTAKLLGITLAEHFHEQHARDASVGSPTSNTLAVQVHVAPLPIRSLPSHPRQWAPRTSSPA